MPKHLFIFGYEAPDDRAANERFKSDYESSECVWIEAPSANEALVWGIQIAERFIQQLYACPDESWLRSGFAHWIEADPINQIPACHLPSIQTVVLGQYPDFNKWIR